MRPALQNALAGGKFKIGIPPLKVGINDPVEPYQPYGSGGSDSAGYQAYDPKAGMGAGAGSPQPFGTSPISMSGLKNKLANPYA